MKKINCFGDFCPIPLLKAIEACKSLNTDESFMLVTDHSCTVEAIEEHFQNTHFLLSIDEVINGVWEITIQRKD
jgi:TusA-related sulfurtransferase